MRSAKVLLKAAYISQERVPKDKLRHSGFVGLVGLVVRLKCSLEPNDGV